MTEDESSLDYSYSFLKGIDVTNMPLRIHIPEKDLLSMGNMERQYWEIKAKYFNILIFFKKGKFYELYDYDAVIGNREFGLKMVFDTSNRGKMRLAGIPEQSFYEWVRLFVYRGYKVGRVEQMKEETSEVIKSKVVPRELIEIITPGTVTDPLMISDYKELFVLSLVPLEDGNIDAFAVDLSRHIAHCCPCIKSGRLSSPMNTYEDALLCTINLLYLLRPREILVPNIYDFSDNNLKKCLSTLYDCVKGEGFSVTPFSYPFVKTENNLRNAPARTLLQTYLTYLKVHNDSIFENTTIYSAHTECRNRQIEPEEKMSSCIQWAKKNDHGLFIDAQSTSNLELLANLRDGSDKGSLFEFVNQCVSNGGKRMLLSWILRPSSSSKVIVARQEAVKFLSDALRSSDFVSSRKRERNEGSIFEFDSRFSSFSFDFERQLSRLSEMKNEKENISYVDPQSHYNRNLRLIFSFVDSLSAAVSWSTGFSAEFFGAESYPVLLKEIFSSLARCESSVKRIEQLFDRQASECGGTLVPSEGSFPEYDNAKRCLASINEEIENHKKDLEKKYFGGAKTQFTDLGKDLFLLEVSIKDAPKVSPAGFFERARSSKSVKYIVSSLEPIVSRLKIESLTIASALATNLRRVAGLICEESPAISSAFESISCFDCLLSLGKLHCRNERCSFPKVLENGECCESFICGKGVSHPLLGNSAIPTDITLDSQSGRILLLTGPNMAGKSTLMRSVATNVILAQMGGPVFADDFSFFPISRIFTRIGARDVTHKGFSTLFVELSETAAIFNHADCHSLCLIDELGRGTSTHDGLAISSASLQFLENQPIPPLTIFSTHYHTLALEKHKNRSSDKRINVQLGYMAYHLGSLHSSSVAFSTEVTPITFLYTLTSGICSKSFGIEVAHLAGIPPSVLTTARVQAERMLHHHNVSRDISTLKTLNTINHTSTPHRAQP